jgi:hypothetical protein
MRLTKFEQTLKLIYDICEEKSIPYVIIGGIAGIIHNLSRTTQDIDITLLAKYSEIENIGNVLLKDFKPIKNNPIEFFKKYFVFPSVCKKTNIHVDFAAGLSGFDKIVIDRRLKTNFGNVKVYVCSVEDLIIYKLVANRTQDKADVEQLLNIHKKKLDIKYLTKIAKGFVEVEREDILEYIKSNLI